MSSDDPMHAAMERYLTLLCAYRHSESDGPADAAELGGGDAARALLAAMRGREVEAYLRLATAILRVPDPYATAVLAVGLGTMVEQGMDPTALGEAMATRLPGDLAAARRFVELLEEEHGIEEPGNASREVAIAVAGKEPLGASAWAALKLSTLAGMAAWCRHPPSRRFAARMSRLAEDARFLGRRGGYCYFIGELLHAADGVELLVLAPEQRKGFVVELEAVRNAAHLFALLEDVLVGDPGAGLLEGPRVDPDIAAIARGERDMDIERTFSIGWHYEYWFGVRPEAGARLTGLHPAIAAMIGVEATVDDLPVVKGQAIVLMKRGVLGSRTCEVGGFFAPLHDALRSAVHVRRRLSGEEVDAWVRDLEAEADQIEQPGN
jgi:hypothetical protein